LLTLPSDTPAKLTVKYSEDIVPLIRDQKVNPGQIGSQVEGIHRPALLPGRGQCIAVVQSLKELEAETEERLLLRDVVHGLMDVE
jgi:hypothetical protein